MIGTTGEAQLLGILEASDEMSADGAGRSGETGRVGVFASEGAIGKLVTVKVGASAAAACGSVDAGVKSSGTVAGRVAGAPGPVAAAEPLAESSAGCSASGDVVDVAVAGAATVWVGTVGSAAGWVAGATAEALEAPAAGDAGDTVTAAAAAAALPVEPACCAVARGETTASAC